MAITGEGRESVVAILGHKRVSYIRYKSVFISSNHNVLVVIVLRSGPRGAI